MPLFRVFFEILISKIFSSPVFFFKFQSISFDFAKTFPSTVEMTTEKFSPFVFTTVKHQKSSSKSFYFLYSMRK